MPEKIPQLRSVEALFIDARTIKNELVDHFYMRNSGISEQDLDAIMKMSYELGNAKIIADKLFEYWMKGRISKH